jgi:eukaryotic-like serine/threonine-protein kinase
MKLPGDRMGPYRLLRELEELFALGGAHLRQFDALLSRSLSGGRSPLRLLTTLRSDYIHRLEQTPGLARLLNGKASRYHLRPMGEEALAQVIRGMAVRAGLRLSEDLPERMVRDAAGTEGGHGPLSTGSICSRGTPRRREDG